VQRGYEISRKGKTVICRLSAVGGVSTSPARITHPIRSVAAAEQFYADCITRIRCQSETYAPVGPGVWIHTNPHAVAMIRTMRRQLKLQQARGVSAGSTGNKLRLEVGTAYNIEQSDLPPSGAGPACLLLSPCYKRIGGQRPPIRSRIEKLLRTCTACRPKRPASDRRSSTSARRGSDRNRSYPGSTHRDSRW
jgi:hypothetical protein